MDKLHHHYRLLLGLDESWNVEDVDLCLEDKRVSLRLSHAGGPVCCPKCGAACSIADHAPERTWRHLDTMQFETRLQARVPRSKCAECGVKTVAVPWAGKHSRFTLLFEAMVLSVLNACGNAQAAALLLGLDWDAVHGIMKRAVDRGLQRRQPEPIPHVGMDEKSFGRGQSYISLMTDLDQSRVLEVVEERTIEAAERLWDTLAEEQRAAVEAVALDMWPAFIKAARTKAPQAALVHDRFHISRYLTEAVDRVRRAEHKALKKEGDDTLTGTRQLWLFNLENLDPDRLLEFEALRDLELKTARAWTLKENFRWFWEYARAGNARRFFEKWYGWAVRSRLEPIRKVAKMLKRHLENLLTWFRHPITNAVTEGLNSRIQGIKAQARGFRSFENYRTRILFYCGKLDLMPELPTHYNS